MGRQMRDSEETSAWEERVMAGEKWRQVLQMGGNPRQAWLKEQEPVLQVQEE